MNLTIDFGDAIAVKECVAALRRTLPEDGTRGDHNDAWVRGLADDIENCLSEVLDVRTERDEAVAEVIVLRDNLARACVEILELRAGCMAMKAKP